jgi:phospholipase C
MSKYVVPLLALASAANAVSLGDVKHVIMVMFENRSFNHVSVYGRAGDVNSLINRNAHSYLYSISALSLVFEVLPIPT